MNVLEELADGLPNAVVVMGCLEDLYTKGKEHLTRPKLVRLNRDHEPLRLAAKRTRDVVHALVGRRLVVLFDRLEVVADPTRPLAPFTAEPLDPLTKLQRRDILDSLRRYRVKCQAAGEWVKPEWDAGANRR